MEFHLHFWSALGADLVEVLKCRVSVVGSSLSFKKGDHLEPCIRVLKCDVIKN